MSLKKGRHYFPLGKAYQEAFCNRTKETDWLCQNLLHGKHSLLVAPRRYGKSSLAERAIEKSGLPSAKLSFHMSITAQDVTQLILRKVAKLVSECLGPVEKNIHLIKEFTKNITPRLSFANDLVSLELVKQGEMSDADRIVEALLLLENLLRKKNQQAAIFFDEFQEITKIPESEVIEGAIRTAAQEMSNLSIIFSGSLRSLLLSMFEEESRPLYKLCRKLKLKRIDGQCYEKHIQHIAQLTWDKPLEHEVFEHIITLSNRHPYYTNYLCDVTWSLQEFPTISLVNQAWKIIISEDWGDAVKEITQLTANQRIVMRAIAEGKNTGLTSHKMSAALDIAVSSIQMALVSLQEKDFIELTNEGHFEIINPLLKVVLLA